MKTRVISAIIALPIFIIPLLVGGPLMYLLIIVATGIGLHEFDKAFGINDKVIYSFQLLCSALLYFVMWFEKDGFFFSAGVLLFVLLFIYYVLVYPKIELEHVFYGLVAFYYLPLMLSHVLLVRSMDEVGGVMVWLIFIISFGSDTFAYFVGRTFGKHKLAKELSPKKTIEGAIGGIAGAALLSVLYAVYVGSSSMELTSAHYILFGVMGAIGSIFSQFGDISASAMKRVSGVKDFGKIMPGHGGILDRIDAVLFVAPFVYYCLKFILKVM